jgi:hypothetical protein
MSGRLYLLVMVWVVLQVLWPACPSASAVEAFCLTPVIACLFFVAGVVCVGGASVQLCSQRRGTVDACQTFHNSPFEV